MNISSGSFNITKSKIGFDKKRNFWRFSASGSWQNPPKTLIPGRQYVMQTSLTGSFHLQGSYGFSIYMDRHHSKCGGRTGARCKISKGLDVRVSKNHSAQWTGTFKSPEKDYGEEDQKFQIKVATDDGCVRYIYGWKP